MIVIGADAKPYLVSDIVEDNAVWAADDPAIIFKDRTWTWREFRDGMHTLRRGLSREGVVRGSRVAILERNCDEYILLHYALASMGAILVPINIWLRTPEIAYILASSQPNMLVVGAEFADTAAAAINALADAPRLVFRGGATSGHLRWSDLLAHGPSAALSTPASWDDPHIILYTSGTTGRPKGAIISHRRTVLDALAASGAYGIRTGERFYCYMPLFHTGAWDYFKLFFYRRGAVVLAERFDAEEAVELIERHRCNGMFSVPLTLRQIVEAPSFAEADMSSMRFVAYGSYDPSNVMVRVLNAFRERGAHEVGITHVYGMTEAGPFISFMPPDRAEQKPGSIGRPLPGVQLRLLDEEMKPVAAGETGEICLRAPCLMSGYLNRPEATAEAFGGGWLHTGDLGRVDEEGDLHLVDRKKDMIRSGGENVFAKEVEQILIVHPAIRDCAVVGLPDADYGERVVAAVMLEETGATDELDVIAYVRQRIAGFKTPRQIFFVEEFPRTPAGKIQKHLLRESLLLSAVS
jgi:fatty-acyl-CoA synthase